MQYTQHKGAVKHVTGCGGGRAVASAADDGAIHVFQIETPSVMYRQRQVDLDVAGQITCLQPLSAASPVLAYSTVRGHIEGWDTRTASSGWKLEAFPHHGLLNAFVVDPNESWLVAGSARGVYTLWDLRFQLPIKSWLHPGQQPVHSLGHFPAVAAPMHGGSHPQWDPDSWVLAAAGDHSASIWDVKTSSVVARFNAAPIKVELPLDNDVLGRGGHGGVPQQLLTSVDGSPTANPTTIEPPRSTAQFLRLAMQRRQGQADGGVGGSSRGGGGAKGKGKGKGEVTARQAEEQWRQMGWVPIFPFLIRLWLA
jgi:WD40 repeat protein